MIANGTSISCTIPSQDNNGQVLPARASLAHGFRRGWTNFKKRLREYRRRRATRQQLLELDLRGLKDIGISPADAEREANLPFWRPQSFGGKACRNSLRN